MNTYTNSMHPKKAVSQASRNRLFQNAVSITVALALVIVAVTAIYLANLPVAATNSPSVTYGNALELQYAQPWLNAQNKSVVTYGNALEWQYARPWLEAQQQILLNCHSSLEMLYACQYGRP